MASQFDYKQVKKLDKRRLIDEFLHAYYPAYGPSQLLCDSCAQKGVQQQLFGRKRGEGVHLGTLEELRSRKDCQFCALVLDIFAHNPLHLPVRAEFHTWRRPDHTIRVVSGRMSATIALESNFRSLRRSLMLVDRPIPARAGLPRLQSWLHDCEHGREAHSNCARAASAVLPNTCDESIDLILIDVKRICLVEYRNGKPSNFPRYVALSYVWGTSKTLKTTMRTLALWKNVGSLPLTRMPNTIHDAFHVVRNIGETYLWVDQLCIVQDDPQHKQQLIPRMHEIYRRAVLTIIAVSGEHADAGLPGIRSTERSRGHTTITRLPRLTTLPFRRLIVTHAPSFESILLESCYDKRAWTLQERLLSRRRVYFTKIGMYFNCVSGIIPECDVSSEHRSTHDPLAILRPSTTGISAMVSRHDQFKAYASFVEFYSNRSLSLPEEVLDACAGVFLDIREHTGGNCRHLHGIPPKFFELSLLWIHVREKGHPPGLSSSLDNITYSSPLIFGHQSQAAQGSNESDQTPRCATYERDKKQRNQNFPTWSWAGWFSQVSYALPNWICSLEREINLSACCQLNPHRMSGDDRRSFTMLPKQIPDTRILEFTTSVIDADRFMSSEMFYPHLLGCVNPDIRRRYEFDAVGGGATRDKYEWHFGAELFYKTCDGWCVCGTLFDGNCDDLPAQPRRMHGPLQFISLFKIKPRNPATYGIFKSFVAKHLIPEHILVKQYNAAMTYQPMPRRFTQESAVEKILSEVSRQDDAYDRAEFDKITWLYDDILSAVHLVMLIEWKGDCAERVALGQIAEFAWESSGPKRKRIQLR
jgi:hypothetical protein